ncbi:MAG: inositol monophosphatase family protein, partial [Paracoccaceae bacterium]
MLTQGEVDELIAVAAELADAARGATLRHFRRADLSADTKEADCFDPVTIADRESEDAMRAVLAQRRPQDGILGEERLARASRSGLTWVLDPIDGTRAYLAGLPTWGVLIALADDNGPIYGLIDQPYINERFEGGFGYAQMQGPLGQRALKTRAPRALDQTIIMTTFPEVGTAAEGQAFHALAKKCRLVRYGMDCYAYAMLAAGHIDLVVEAGLQAYDVQAP